MESLGLGGFFSFSLSVLFLGFSFSFSFSLSTLSFSLLSFSFSLSVIFPGLSVGLVLKRMPLACKEITKLIYYQQQIHLNPSLRKPFEPLLYPIRPGSDTSSVWNFSSGSPDVISRENQSPSLCLLLEAEGWGSTVLVFLVITRASKSFIVKLDTLAIMIFQPRHRGRISSVDRALYCRAGGRGFDSRGRTNTQGLKKTEK